MVHANKPSIWKAEAKGLQNVFGWPWLPSKTLRSCFKRTNRKGKGKKIWHAWPKFVCPLPPHPHGSAYKHEHTRTMAPEDKENFQKREREKSLACVCLRYPAPNSSWLDATSVTWPWRVTAECSSGFYTRANICSYPFFTQAAVNKRPQSWVMALFSPRP